MELIVDEFRRGIADLGDSLVADTDPLEYIDAGVRLLGLLERTAQDLQQRLVSDDLADRLLAVLVPLMNQRLTWMNVYRNTATLIESDASPTRAVALPQDLRDRFAALTPEQQYLATEQAYTSIKVLVAEHLLSAWTFTSEVRENIIVGFLTPVILHDTKWFHAFSDPIRQHVAMLPDRPPQNTHASPGLQRLTAGRESVVIDLGHAMAELDRRSLVGIARALQDHDAKHLDPSLAYLDAFRQFVTSDASLTLPAQDYARFDDAQQFNAKSLLDAMASSPVTSPQRNLTWFDTARRRYIVIMPEQTDFAAVNSMDEYEAYAASPHEYILAHRHQRHDWKAVRLCAVREEALLSLGRDVRATQTSDALRGQMQTYAVAFQAAGVAAMAHADQLTNEVRTWMHDYATRAAAHAPAAAVTATLRGTLFYFVIKELGGAEPLIVGTAEAIVEFLLHTAFPPSHNQPRGTPKSHIELEEQKRALDLQIAIEKAKRELAKLRKESE
ncbi:MAG: hypothetical protein ACXW4P_03810 [Thermoanaerobaculia bacterium]